MAKQAADARQSPDRVGAIKQLRKQLSRSSKKASNPTDDDPNKPSTNSTSVQEQRDDSAANQEPRDANSKSCGQPNHTAPGTKDSNSTGSTRASTEKGRRRSPTSMVDTSDPRGVQSKKLRGTPTENKNNQSKDSEKSGSIAPTHTSTATKKKPRNVFKSPGPPMSRGTKPPTKKTGGWLGRFGRSQKKNQSEMDTAAAKASLSSKPQDKTTVSGPSAQSLPTGSHNNLASAGVDEKKVTTTPNQSNASSPSKLQNKTAVPDEHKVTAPNQESIDTIISKPKTPSRKEENGEHGSTEASTADGILGVLRMLRKTLNSPDEGDHTADQSSSKTPTSEQEKKKEDASSENPNDKIKPKQTSLPTSPQEETEKACSAASKTSTNNCDKEKDKDAVAKYRKPVKLSSSHHSNNGDSSPTCGKPTSSPQKATESSNQNGTKKVRVASSKISTNNPRKEKENGANGDSGPTCGKPTSSPLKTTESSNQNGTKKVCVASSKILINKPGKEKENGANGDSGPTCGKPTSSPQKATESNNENGSENQETANVIGSSSQPGAPSNGNGKESVKSLPNSPQKQSSKPSDISPTKASMDNSKKQKDTDAVDKKQALKEIKLSSGKKGRDAAILHDLKSQTSASNTTGDEESDLRNASADEAVHPQTSFGQASTVVQLTNLLDALNKKQQEEENGDMPDDDFEDTSVDSTEDAPTGEPVPSILSSYSAGTNEDNEEPPREEKPQPGFGVFGKLCYPFLACISDTDMYVPAGSTAIVFENETETDRNAESIYPQESRDEIRHSWSTVDSGDEEDGRDGDDDDDDEPSIRYCDSLTSSTSDDYAETPLENLSVFSRPRKKGKYRKLLKSRWRQAAKKGMEEHRRGTHECVCACTT